ncbi:urease accessory protein [Stackebrandtia endophytica]|uniref:Urease accessory protein n=1 Tax=Stackebrandtia endophytica TaxID=1496996 RepID=A0A543AVN3_9ACTN|nr:urease accessory UreF family protein [Stackebrandtia endophytica]TQL76637.1 urease accessory protein [Stackebrandtia endophytica]
MSGEFGALLLSDARLPIGGHAYSAGLEPGLLDGMSATDIPRYLEARLRTVGFVEAAAAVLAHRTVTRDPDGLGTVHDALLARTPSAPARQVSAMLGRGLYRLGTRLWPDHPAITALRGLGNAPQRPVAFGVVAAAMNLDAEHIARSSLYDDAQTVASAALKLAPADPVDVVGWVLAAEPTISRLVSEAVAEWTPDTLPSVTAPQIEVWSLDHKHRTRRIFVA